jgi:hypothetical protein
VLSRLGLPIRLGVPVASLLWRVIRYFNTLRINDSLRRISLGNKVEEDGLDRGLAYDLGNLVDREPELREREFDYAGLH